MPNTSASALSDLFSSAESFMYFADGLDAYREFRERDFRRAPLDRATEAFREGVSRFPMDGVLRFYHALMLLEEASVVGQPDADESADGPSAPAGPSEPEPILSTIRASSVADISIGDGYSEDDGLLRLRDELIEQALVELDIYQRQLKARSEDGRDRLSDWLFLWSEYNRAAAQVHRLMPYGYLAAREILTPYLSREAADRFKPGPWRESLSMQARSLAGPPLLEWLRDLALRILRRPGRPLIDSPRTLELQAWLRGQDAEGEYQALRLQMESLLNVTHVRPMREPESLRRMLLGRSEGGLSLEYENLDRLEQRLDGLFASLQSPEIRDKIGPEALRDLTSDFWSQRGHLICARALRDAEITPADVFARWPELSRPLDNAVSFRILALEAGGSRMARALENAAKAFSTALSFQPRWIPAIRNRDEVLETLAAIARPPWTIVGSH